MRKYLFLDDDEIRHNIFTKYIDEHIGKQEDYLVCHAVNFEEATSYFKSHQEWEIIFLDHDLGMEDQMCTPGLNNRYPTGTDVAQFMVDNKVVTKAVVLHSFNPAGVQRMIAILESSYPIYLVPFGAVYLKPILDLLKDGKPN